MMIETTIHCRIVDESCRILYLSVVVCMCVMKVIVLLCVAHMYILFVVVVVFSTAAYKK